MKKRIMSLILALAMAFSLLPVTAKAESPSASFQYKVLEDHVEITRALVTSAHVEIPAEIEDKPVTHIGMLAFMGQNLLTSITIPETVTNIGAFAFTGCANLSTIYFLGTPPQWIEPSAFSGVTATACYPADQPQLMEYMDMQSYGGALTWIRHDHYHAPDYTLTISEPTCTEYGWIHYTFACGCSDYSLDYPAPLEHDFVGGVCTRCGDLDHVPDENLQYIIYDDHVEITGYTGDAQALLLPTEIDEKPVTVICERAFFGCSSMASVDLPDLLHTIEREAFSSCSNLTELSLPNQVYYLHAYAFSECPLLTRVYISAGVGYIHESAFHRCINLTRFEVSRWNEHYYTDDHGVLFYTYPPYESLPEDLPCLFKAPDAIAGSYTIPEGIASIGRYAFDSCFSLTDITIPDSVVNIFDSAFYGCISLQSITFHGDAPYIDPYAFDAVTATACYPGGNATWTADVMQDYGGTITWIPSTPDTPSTPDNPFTDVPENSFYYEPVLWALGNSITTGASADSFDPTGACLRAHVVTFLYRAEGSPEPSSYEHPFTDVNASDFFYLPVLWAVENKITTGVSDHEFGSRNVCSRAQVVTFLWRAAGSPKPQAANNPFEDVHPSNWFYDAVLWAVENGITTGVDATHFGPTVDCNRAQVVTFLYRAYN